MTSMRLFASRPYALYLLVSGLLLGWAGSATATITLSVDKPLIREEDDRVEITVTAESDENVTANTVVSLQLGAKTFPNVNNPAENRLPNGVGNIFPGRTIDEHGRIVLTYRLASGERADYVSPNAPWWAYRNADPTRGSIAANRKPGGDWKDWLNSRAQVNSQFSITLPTLVIPKDKKKATGTIVLTNLDNDKRGFYNTYDEFTIPHQLDLDESVYFFNGALRNREGFQRPWDSNLFNFYRNRPQRALSRSHHQN